MKIQKVKIKGYKIFEDVTINMNENINIFVRENDSGKLLYWKQSRWL